MSLILLAMNSEETNTRQSKTTDESREESRRLKEIWDSRPHPVQSIFGEQFEIGNQSAVGQFLNGKVVLSMKAALGFARGLKCEIIEFSPRLARMAEGIAASVGAAPTPFEEVKRTGVRLSAGSGSIEDIYEDVGSLSFRRDFLKSCGVSPENARVVDVRGTSMEPTIPDGSVLLINIANLEPHSGKVFALAKGQDGLVIKRLIKVEEAWYARSDNPDGNPDFQINDGIPVTILGRAVWMGAKL